MAKILYDFLPGSGNPAWTNHVSFKTVARDVGVGQFWQGGSKQPAIATLLELTLLNARDRFERLILTIIREGMKYREKSNDPVREEEIRTLNGLIYEVGFKFPDMWDLAFLGALRTGGVERASEIVERQLKEEDLKASAISAKQNKLDQLKSEFYQLVKDSNRQAAGLALEKLLNSLFRLFDLHPRNPFRVTGEQIDGSFELDNEVYLLEAKWESSALSEAPLMVFREKIQGKSSITRGLFIALNGCTSDALDAITRGKQPNFFLMDGYDLTTILEGQINLDALLREKVRKFAEEGRVFLSAKDFRR